MIYDTNTHWSTNCAHRWASEPFWRRLFNGIFMRCQSCGWRMTNRDLEDTIRMG